MNTTAVAFHGAPPASSTVIETVVDVSDDIKSNERLIAYDAKLSTLSRELDILKYANQKRQTEIHKLEIDASECKKTVNDLVAADASQIICNTELLSVITILNKRITFLFFCLVGINIFNWIILFTYFRMK